MTDVWAVGSAGSKTLIERWNGKRWAVALGRGAAPAGNLTGVTATSGRNAWAVGERFDSKGFESTLILHWNGKTWQRIPSPNPGSQTNDSLLAIDATSAQNTWAVGIYFNRNQADQTIAIHCCGRPRGSE